MTHPGSGVIKLGSGLKETAMAMSPDSHGRAQLPELRWRGG